VAVRGDRPLLSEMAGKACQRWFYEQTALSCLKSIGNYAGIQTS